MPHQECDKEIKYIPAVLPEVSEAVHPFEEYLQHEDKQRVVVKDIQKHCEPSQLWVIILAQLL